MSLIHDKRILIPSCRVRARWDAGLIYRMVSPKVVLLIFVSGKLVITGAFLSPSAASPFRTLTAPLACLALRQLDALLQAQKTVSRSTARSKTYFQ